MKGQRAFVVTALLIAWVLAAPPALGQHGHGEPTSSSGYVNLSPSGGGSDVGVVSLLSAGIDLAPGYSFEFSWASDNGTGPSVHFEIFAHSASLHVIYYTSNGSRDSGTWQVPSADLYEVSWTNPSPLAVNVTYAFRGIPNSDASLILAAAGGFILLIVAYAVISVRKIAREGAPPAEKPGGAARAETAPSEAPRGGNPKNPPR